MCIYIYCYKFGLYILHPDKRNVRDEHVVGDVVEVSAVLQPGASRADVVCGALLIDLD